MTVYARNDLASTTISEAHGGCGNVHTRPAPGGNPVAVWSLTCAQCEDHLRHSADQWSTTAAEIPETHDETKGRENFRGSGRPARSGPSACAGTPTLRESPIATGMRHGTGSYSTTRLSALRR